MIDIFGKDRHLLEQWIMDNIDLKAIREKRYLDRKAIIDQFTVKEVEPKTPLTEAEIKEIAQKVNDDLVTHQKGTQDRIKAHMNGQSEYKQQGQRI